MALGHGAARALAYDRRRGFRDGLTVMIAKEGILFGAL
jgi:hypothetical protein